jgi:hypothetical protein
VLVPVGMKFAAANGDPDGVREDVAGQFLWSFARLGGVALLGPAAWASMLPMSIAAVAGVLAWWRREANVDNGRSGCTSIAWTLAWAWIVSVLVLVLAGVSNHRYALASAVLLGPLAAWGLSAWEKRGAASHERGVDEAPAAQSKSRVPVAACALGVLLTIAGGAFAIMSMFPTKDQQAGVELAARLAEAVPPGVRVWADDAIEARPDILWMLQQRTDRMRKNISVSWGKRDMLEGKLPRKGDCLLLRTDPESSEADRYKDAIVSGRLERLTSDTVRRHEYTLFRVQYNAP